MANEYGLELVIPDGFIEKLKQADEELEYTAMQAEETKERVISAFREMGDQGVDHFLKKLRNMQDALAGITSKNITLKGLEQSTKGAAAAADDVVKVADAFGQVSQTAPAVGTDLKNIDEAMARMMNEIRMSREELALYDEFLHKDVISLDEYNRGVEATSERLDALMRGYEALGQTREAYKAQEDGQDLGAIRQQEELEKLNEAFRTGTSEMQKKAKMEDEEAKRLEKEAREREKIHKAQEKADAKAQKDAEKRSKEQERLNKLKEEEQRKTYNGALQYSQSATSITQETQAIKYLTAARDNLSKTDENYKKKLNTLNNAILQHEKNIARAKGETLNFERQQKSLLNTTDQLKRSIALVFSVSAIRGYMKDIAAVRGEFELQKVALGAILQNKEKADELWARTQELALKSPFKLMQLVTFTKQLAAYQVEADKLYDTTKRLADVSAGLGVDMGRLILAFGQVKAANYLRSAEIRQFTEAGINMLGELSKLYTELEGKMVSVGEVQARVQKRMVSFGDVEEVFKRMTDAGGMFYNMQEKQAETLKGMIAKLGDALDIMLNQIGEANEGVLKGFVQTLLTVLQSWEKIGQVVTPIISVLIARMALLKLTTMSFGKSGLLKGLIDSLKLATTWAFKSKKAFQELRAATAEVSTAAGGWITILSALAIVLWEVRSAIHAQVKEQKQINQVIIESTYSAHKMVARYEQLVKILQDQTTSYQEQKDALGELQRTYGEILPAEYLEIENIRTMGDEYAKARDAIYAYMEAKGKQKQLEVVEANEGAKLQSEQNKLVTSLLKTLQKKGVPAERMEIAEMMRQIVEAQRDGTISTLKEARKMLIDLMEETYEITLSQNDLYYAGLEYYQGSENLQKLDDILKTARKYYQKIDDITNAKVGLLDASTRRLQDARRAFDAANDDVKKAFAAVQNYDLLTDEQRKQAIATLKAFYSDMKEEMPDWSEVYKDPLTFDEETRKFNQMWLDAMVKDVSERFKRVEAVTDSTNQVLQTSWDKFTEDVQKEIDTQNIERWQSAIQGAVREFVDSHEWSLEGMQAVVSKAGQTEEDYFKGIKGEVDRLKQDIGQLQIYKEETPKYLWSQSDDEELSRMEEMLAIYEYIYSLYYDAKKADKDSDKEDREALNLLKERVRLIQEANREYEKNLQYFSKEEAVAKTINAYKGAFKQAGISEFLSEKYLTDQGVLDALAKLPINVGGKLRDEALQYMADTTAKVKVELDTDTRKEALKNLKDEVEALFSDVDVFEDLAKLGFTEEEARNIFGLDVTTIEELKERLISLRDEFIGSKGLEEYNAFLRKVEEMEDKQNVDRLKRYEKYLKTMMRETSEIRIQALQDIQDVMKMQGRTPEEKAAIVEGINREAQRKLQEQQWKQFQESDDYQLLFSDIENLSVRTATRLKDILDNLRTSLNELTPHQLRQIQSQYEKLDEQIIKHNPFKAVSESMKEIKDLASESELNDTIALLTASKEGYQQEIDDIDIILNAKQKGLKLDNLDAATQERLASLMGLTTEELMEQRKGKQGMVDDITEELGLTEEQINRYKRLRKAMAEANNTWSGVMSQTRQTLQNIKEAYDAADEGTQDITFGIIEAGMALADAAHEAIALMDSIKAMKKEAPALGAALNSALGIIGLIATAVTAVINVINMLARQHDEGIEQKINRYERSVDKLADAYDRLTDKIQKAYSFAQLAMATDETLANQQQQILAYERMIAYEQDKKESDSDKIDEWNKKIEELRENMDEARRQAVINAGGLGGEYKDAAQGFVDAWMQAFRETGNGLDALNEHFEDFLWDIAGKQVLLRAADKYFEPLFEELDNRMTADTSSYDQKEKEILKQMDARKEVIANISGMPYEMAEEMYNSGKLNLQGFNKYMEEIAKYGEDLAEVQKAREKAIQEALELDDEDFEALKAQYEVSGKNFDDFAKKWLESTGFKGGEEGDTLSGLQRGIEGITEATAEIIEAYLNSVRFFVSDSNDKLTDLLNRFKDTEGTMNPMLNELKKQTGLIEKIHTIFKSVVVDTGTIRGFAIKIQQ